MGVDTIFYSSFTGLGFATEIKSARQKKLRQNGSCEAKTAEQVTEIATKRAPHLVALARINAGAEKLHERVRMKRQEPEIIERVMGAVGSSERGKSGLGEKHRSPKLLDGLPTVGIRGLSRFLVTARLLGKCRCLEKSDDQSVRGILCLTNPRSCRELTR